MDQIYNPLKLSVYRPLFLSKKVLIIGGGAVGSNVAEAIAKMGANPDVIDFDRFSMENAAKHSCLVRTPEDVGRNKAECVSARVKPLLAEGGHTNGIDADLCLLGPEAIAEYDVIVLCVDNFAAKVLFNELWMQIPKERRPVVIMDGTHDEMAQSVILDGSDFCLRCLIDESWLINSAVRTSCSGPQFRQIDGVEEIVRTSGLASSIAANLSAEQFRSCVIGLPNVLNRRITYTAYPNLELGVARPMRKRGCHGCTIHPPVKINWLSGSIVSLTLREAIKQISDELGTNDFEIAVHRLNYKNVVHSGFIINDVCHSCGKPIRVMKHEGRTFLRDLRCDECVAADRHTHYSNAYMPGTIIYAFTPNCDESLMEMTLYELGYPLGAHIEVIERNGALDFLDKDKIVISTFACSDDSRIMHKIQKL